MFPLKNLHASTIKVNIDNIEKTEKLKKIFEEKEIDQAIVNNIIMDKEVKLTIKNIHIDPSLFYFKFMVELNDHVKK